MLFIQFCYGAFCPSILARGKAANILAIFIGIAIIVGLLVWLDAKRSRATVA